MIKDIVKQMLRLPVGKTDLLPGRNESESAPLDPESPWPKFRGNSIQNGRSRVVPTPSDLAPWEFKTGKGIFSSPVIDGNNIIYIGSGDHYFYAVTPEGEEKWRFATDEIIDASALLDDQNRVFFGSGDGHVYCLDRETGQKIWSFAAHSTQEVEKLYNIKTYNLNWFEGNTAMLADGTLLAPNDNYLVYSMDRVSGKPKACYLANEMVWSCPAVNSNTHRIFFASCFNAVVNVFCYDTRTGKKIWTSGGLGTVSASPLLTSKEPDGAVLVGGFDGILRAFSQKNGRKLWSFGARDHIYGSPAQLSSGVIVQAACDGTVYGLNPETGKQIWHFDTSEPIRSSPVVDGEDRIYFGSGEGCLYCLNRDGSFRWAYQCIEDRRSDLNGSPALGTLGVCIAGENGGLFFVPYDYPLTPQGQKDPRCLDSHQSREDGCYFFYVDHFGRPLPEPPDIIDANEPVMLAHMVRDNNQTLLSAIDATSLDVSVDGNTEARVALSADKRFITLIPSETWTGPDGGRLDIRVRCRIKTGLKRLGLKFFRGKKTHTYDGRFNMDVAPFLDDGRVMPYQIPQNPGQKGTVLDISRLSCPHPTMLPSYNQIGFDSLHYLAVLVGESDTGTVLWVVPGRLDEATGETVVDPTLTDIHVMEMNYQNGLVTLYNYDGFAISFVGSWDMPFSLYRMAARVDTADGRPLGPAALSAVIRCDDIKFYGRFLKLTGMSDFKTGLMHICGGLDISVWNHKTKPDIAQEKPCQTTDRDMSLHITPTRAEAIFQTPAHKDGDHVWGILLLDRSSGHPLALDYAGNTRVKTDSGGQVLKVVLDYKDTPVSGKVTGIVMKDTCMACKIETVVAS